MFEACESSALLIVAALKHYFFSLCFFVFNFFKSCSLFNQALITVLMFSFSKHSTVMSVRNCNNTLMTLRSFSNLLSDQRTSLERESENDIPRLFFAREQL